MNRPSYFLMAMTLFLSNLQNVCLSQSPGDASMRDVIFAAADRITENCLTDIRSKSGWETEREAIRKDLKFMLGLEPWPERTPLEATVTHVHELPDYRIENLHFQSLPQFYVTANLYIPNEGQAPFPVIVYLCGHARNDAGSKGHYSHHPEWLARHGYAVLIVDAIQLSEIPGKHRGTHTHGLFDWYARGYTPAGIEVWNAIRALDYLETRPEIDMQHLGMTGRSGGGSMSLFTAAIEDRVKVVVTANCTSTIATHVKSDTVRGHCDCAFHLNALQRCFSELGACLAPRPYLILNGRYDRIFPPEGYSVFAEKVESIYTLLEAADQFMSIESVAGHKDLLMFQTEAFHWFEKHLKGIDSDESVVKLERDPIETQLVFTDGLPEGFINDDIEHRFVTLAQEPKIETKEQWLRHATQLRKELKRYVFGALPKERGVVRPTIVSVTNDDKSRVIDLKFESEPGMVLPARLIVPAEPKLGELSLIWIGNGEDQAEFDAFRKTWPDHAILYLTVRGVGALAFDPEIEKRFHRRAAILVGATRDSMRVWDVMRALDLLQMMSDGAGEKVAVYGRGALGVIGLYAAVWDARIKGAILHDPPTNHTQDPIFLNILRFTDLPWAAPLIAPSKLAFLEERPPEFDWSAKVYETLGQTGGCITGPTLPDLLTQIAEQEQLDQ